MNIETKTQEYIDRYPERMMTTEKFWDALVNKYNNIRNELRNTDLENDVIDDLLQDLAAWGGSQDWASWSRAAVSNYYKNEAKNIRRGKLEPDTNYGHRGMKLTLGWLYRNKQRNQKEFPFGEGGQTEGEPDALDGYLTFDMDEFEQGDSATRLLDSMTNTDELDNSELTNDLRPTEIYLAALTEKQRECVELRYKGFNQVEIGEMLGVGQRAIAYHLEAAYKKLLEFPELKRAARQFSDEWDVLVEEGVATWLFGSFPYDPRETKYETLGCYKELDHDDSPLALHMRRWDALLSSDRLCNKDIAETQLNPRIYATELATNYISRPAPIAQDEKPKDYYWSGASRLFNCLGPSRDISQETECFIIRMLGSKSNVNM